ncbi:MAG: hypothetical protein LBH54_05650 [Clostridiales bacterium]|jgi:hypothetical protein|nr:hypothetical protein [Clostridiales bacterium]
MRKFILLLAVAAVTTLSACSSVGSKSAVEPLPSPTSTAAPDVQTVLVERTLTAATVFEASAFAETLDYEQDGYAGTLSRVEGSFTIAANRETRSECVSDTKRYGSLARNDVSVIAKEYNGMTLTTVDFYEQDTDRPISGFTQGTPGPYYAVARYEGTRKTTVITGYTAIVTYSGAVERTETQ